MATVALTLSLLAFPLLVTWNILLVATPSVAALILGYRARRSIGDSDQIDHRRARDRAGVAMALGAMPIVLAILILVFLVAGAYG